MSEVKWIQVSLANFEKLTGASFTHFAANVLRGDGWGSFLKIAGVVEESSKRAIGIKLGLDPSSFAVGRLGFYSALLLCKEANLITTEAYEFADDLREIRNDLAHKGGVLDLDIEKVRGLKLLNRYRRRVEAFVSLEGKSLANGEREHLNTLVVGCVVYVGQLSKALFNDDWIASGG